MRSGPCRWRGSGETPDPLGHQREHVAQPPRPARREPEQRGRQPRPRAGRTSAGCPRARSRRRRRSATPRGARAAPPATARRERARGRTGRHSPSAPPSPWAGNTARCVASTARSTSSAGSNPSDQSRHDGVAPSVIRSRRGQAVALGDVRPPPLGHRGLRRDRRARRLGQQVGPRPRHDLRQLVAAAAAGDPPAARVRGARGRAARRTTTRWPSTVSPRCASGSSTWLSQPCCVTRTSGRNSSSSAGTTAVERAQPAGVRGARRQRQVHGRAVGAGPPRSSGNPVPGKR